MFKNKSYQNTTFAPCNGSTYTLFYEDFGDTETGTLEIIGTGEIKVRNTGGSSASEGGMGSDSNTGNDKAKGDLTKPGTGQEGTRSVEEDDSDITFDPIKKNVREAERKQSSD
ncbi:MAG: hypothetical protein AVDCRST_MAG96-24 [uncultured Segetibacter sp.]|uniref:Uncharacterized protein n=1 Tax=uncultured Segetibacter sp. TaxID=481133 RepID=A0A6J4R730_9BACT|nr:MAG: hypothetical protein AVDCRST_MAG96-24 [uncultured Segetibacter sp.]